MAPRVSNPQLLWFKYEDTYTQDQITEEIERILKDLELACERGAIEIDPKKDIPHIHYVLSFVGKKNESHLWLYRGNMWVRNILLGFKADGSKNVELVKDKSWKPSSEEELNAMALKIKDTASWAEKVELNEKYEMMLAKECPVTEKPLPSYTNIPFNFCKGSVKDATAKENRTVLITKHPVNGLMYEEQQNLLNIMARDFSRFASTKTPNGKSYPIITHREGKIAIEYGRDTDDAVMALNMTTSARYRTYVGSREIELEIWYEKAQQRNHNHDNSRNDRGGGRRGNGRNDRGGSRRGNGRNDSHDYDDSDDRRWNRVNRRR